MYDKLSGMTGTAETEESEFHQIYGLDVLVIPTNRDVIRDDRDDLIFRTKREKYVAIMDEVERFHAMEGRDAIPVAKEIHGALNELIRRDSEADADARKIQCRRGCSHCCSNPVEIGPHEAAALVAAAREAGIELDRAKLARQAAQTIESWPKQPAADRACVFLGADGACRVYAARPVACRKLFVTSDPVLCDTAKYTPADTVRWFSWESEMLAVAALEVFGGGLMPAQLLAALGEPGERDG